MGVGDVLDHAMYGAGVPHSPVLDGDALADLEIRA